MHQNVKLTPVLRKEVFHKWRLGKHSMRALAREYHVDKRVIGRVVARGVKGDFSVHSSTNVRYKKKIISKAQ